MSIIARKSTFTSNDINSVENERSLFLNETEVSIEQLMQEPIDSLKMTAAKNRITLFYEPTNIKANLKLDKDKIQASFIHVVQNAIKYSNNSTSVYVMTGFDFNGDFYIRIDDEGLGIVDDVLQRILEPFTRVENGVESSRANAGRGLNMVNAHLKMHFGYLRIQSQQNRGTSVTLTLPKSIHISR